MTAAREKKKTRCGSSRDATTCLTSLSTHPSIYPSIHPTSCYNHTINNHQHLHTFLLIFPVLSFSYRRSWIRTESISTLDPGENVATHKDLLHILQPARDSAPDYIQTEGKKFPKSVSSNCSRCNPSPRSRGWVTEGVKRERSGSLGSSTRFTLMQLQASHTWTSSA